MQEGGEEVEGRGEEERERGEEVEERGEEEREREGRESLLDEETSHR